LFRTWSTVALGKAVAGRVEAVQRFDSSFDDVTRRCMAWDGYWSPHDADFLNWRYLGDPVAEHLALALMVGTTLTGYSVVRVEGGRARLMEFVVPHEPPRVAHALLVHTIKA